jgi:hypothetical protein
VTDDPDLRSRLERIASSAGDPPEHGLDRVAARRHRRLRRRRGAVATAAVLAVLAAGAPLISQGLDDEPETVTASESASPAGAPVEVPRLVEVHCDPTGIVVPVASVRPERDGLHMRVYNSLPDATTITVESDDWSSGEIPVAPGVHDVRQPVPPGQLTIGCDIGGTPQRRLVDLVDPSGYYREPELDCDEAERTTLTSLPVAPPSDNIITAARTGLAPHLVDHEGGDAIGPLRGYPSQRLSDATTDPVVQVTRDGDVVAFVHVRGEGGEITEPWTTLSEVEVCASVVAGSSVDDRTSDTTAGTTTTDEPRSGNDPPD